MGEEKNRSHSLKIVLKLFKLVSGSPNLDHVHTDTNLVLTSL